MIKTKPKPLFSPKTAQHHMYLTIKQGNKKNLVLHKTLITELITKHYLISKRLL